MVNRPRAKGTGWESSIVDCLRANGWPLAERRALSGSFDRGDVAGLPAVIEAKACREWDPAGWISELEAEIANAGQDTGVVWIKRRGKTDPLDAYVLTTGRIYLRMLSSATPRAGWEWNPDGSGWQWEADKS